MKSVVLGLAAAVSLAAGAAQAQVPPKPPGAVECAAVYGAFGQDQDQFGATDSLVAERYPAFARIGFDDRLTALAGKAERGVSDLKAAAQDTQSDDYAQLVDAETEGDMSVQPVTDMARLSDACDAQWGFEPSLGGG